MLHKQEKGCDTALWHASLFPAGPERFADHAGKGAQSPAVVDPGQKDGD
jgi:hypothetical protein